MSTSSRIPMSTRSLVLSVVLLSILLPGATHPAAAGLRSGDSADATPAPVPPSVHTVRSGPRLLVAFKPSAPEAARASALRAVGGAVTGLISGLGVTRVTLAGDSADAWSDVPAVVALLANDPAVEWAEQDFTVRLQLTPNDSYYLNDPLTGLGQWGLRKIRADQAWDLQRGVASITVAVIDTGIDPAHPELATVVVPGATFVSSPNEGCTPSTRDDNTHGTHVAGIIGAAGNNGLGVAGVAFGVRIMAIKALDCTGSGTTGDIAQAIMYAVNNGARIVNISLGSPQDSAVIRVAVQAASARNVVLVAAAGNCGNGGGSCSFVNEISYPAAYSGVLAVASTNTDDAHSLFSTIGGYVGISAPGSQIISTAPTYSTFLQRTGTFSGYSVISGTSQATPYVAGTAALLLSKDPTLTAAQVIARLRNTADHLGSAGVNAEFGAGRVNAFNALAASPPTAPSPSPSTSPAPSPSGSPTLPAFTHGASYDTTLVPRVAEFGATASMTVKLTNTSSSIWPSGGPNPVRLAYHWSDPVGQTVIWDGQRTALAADVPPGGTASLNALVLAPATRGVYTVRFDLLREGLGWFSGSSVATGNVLITVNSGYGASYVVPSNTRAPLALGVASTLAVSVTNSGTRLWPAAGPNPVRLSYHWLRADSSVALWEGQRAVLPADLAGGGTALFSLSILPPTTVGTYALRLDLVQEGITWFSAEGVPAQDLPYTVNSGLQPFWTVPAAPQTVLAGGRLSIPITVRNDGLSAWAAGGLTPVRIAPHIVDAIGSTVLWDGPRTLLTVDVPVGGTFTGALIVPAPLVPGSYQVRADMVQEGVTWFSTLGAPVGSLPLIVATDFRATIVLGATTVSRAAPIMPVTLTNTSNALWTIDGQVPVALAPHWYDDVGNVLVWDGPRTKLTAALASGATVNLSVNLGAPPPGAALLAIDVVADGLRWFGLGTPRPVTLTP